MIAFAACVADEAKYRRYAVTGLRQVAEPDSLIVETSTSTSIFAAYNEVLDALADRDDLAGRLVARDHAAIPLGAHAEVLPVDRADVAAADRRGLHREHDLTVPRGRVGELADVDLAVPREEHASHDGSIAAA